QFPYEPTLYEVVNDLYGFGTVLTAPGQNLNNGGLRTAVGDEVLSAYWVKADPARPVSVRLMSAWHSGADCSDPRALSYGSFISWFAKGSTADKYILGGAQQDIQRLLPRDYDVPTKPAASTFDPGTQVFGWHIEHEFSDDTLALQEPWCMTGQVCGHRVRFWPVKDASGGTVANTWIISVDMHQDDPFFANYDFNDETYLVENIKPAP
ncbi:MAG TPA: hypothetical protein VFE93_01615, partial [Myxococcaceae bacterium]|nr:hypothetical protein [Myxococcaceae bacterium]